MNTFKPSRCLPRFSVRTLIGFVTLICFYFGAWELTKTSGTRAVADRVETDVMNPSDMTCGAPFVVSTYANLPDGKASSYPQGPQRHHFLWMVGPLVQLPQGFTKFVERVESEWYEWTNGDHMSPQRVHGGVI